MKVQKKYFERDEKRKLKSIRCIVFHWPGPRQLGNGEFAMQDIDSLWKWINEYSSHSYHKLISKDRIIKTRDPKLRAIHCGHDTYRKKAKDFFGYNVCSKNDSPNNYSLACCIVPDNSMGGYNSVTMDTLISDTANDCIEYKLNPDTDLLRHSDITNEKKIPCPRAFFEDDDGSGADDLWNAFKKWVAVAISMKYEEINNMGNRHSQKYKNIGEER